MRTKHFFLLAVLAGLVILIIYRINENKAAPGMGAQKAQAATTVEGIVLQPQKFAENLSLSGSLEANEQIEIRSEVSGIVEDINFKEGSKVSKGQVLFRVNDSELRAQYNKTSTAEKLAAENARRAKLLLEKEAISREEYDLAEANHKSAQAESQYISAQLAKATVRAPFSGTIGLRYISEGTYVTPSTPIAKLVNTDQLKLTFAIPEKYSGQVQKDAELTFTTAGSPKEYTAQVYAIEPGVDVTTRTLKMRAVTENKTGDLVPGTFANVFLPLATVDDAIMVPTEALIPIQNGKKIFIAKNGLAKEVEVETGSRTADAVRVLSGLNAGDTILTSGIMILKEGSPVNVELRQPVANNVVQ